MPASGNPRSPGKGTPGEGHPSSRFCLCPPRRDCRKIRGHNRSAGNPCSLRRVFHSTGGAEIRTGPPASDTLCFLCAVKWFCFFHRILCPYLFPPDSSFCCQGISQLFYSAVYHTIDDLFLAEYIEDNDGNQRQQIGCKGQIIVCSELCLERQLCQRQRIGSLS